jgi:HAD superfamily phosphoserine phosphatase-like hydrolase
MVSSVIFDLDGTLTKTPSPWRHVHERLGLWETTACTHLDRWLARQISYEEFCRLDTGLWNGRSVEEIYAYLDEIEINRHVPQIVRRLVESGVPSIIISSGFHYIASKIQRHCAWNPLLIYANELTEGPEVRMNVSGDFGSPLSKRALAQQALELVGSTFERTLVVSDTTHDLEQLSDCAYKLQILEEDDLLHVAGYL